jgi:hypothetical protein
MCIQLESEDKDNKELTEELAMEAINLKEF